MTQFSPQCGFFTSIRKRGTNDSVRTLLNGVQQGRWRSDIEKLRSLSGSHYEAAKKRLPAIMLSATTRTGGHKEADLAQHSGLLQIDIDKLGSRKEAVTVREKLRADPHVFAAWLSPSEQGVKAVVRITADLLSHRHAFSTAQTLFAEKHHLTIDPKCGDPCRLCFVSYDPELWINESAVELSGENPPLTLPPSTPSLPPTNYQLQTASCILHNSVVFQDFPHLKPIFENLVTARFPNMQPGLRNAALCELVPLLYSAIDEQFIEPFSEEFFQQHRSVFRADLQTHLHETKVLIEGCKRDYATRELSEAEATAYVCLHDERERCVFRICRSLSLTSGDDMPPPDFYISAEKLAHRLGMLDMQAYRVLQRLVIVHILELTERGERRMKGATPRANRYRWNLPYREGVLFVELNSESPP